MKRKNFLQLTSVVLTGIWAIPSKAVDTLTNAKSNFRYIYQNSKLKKEFKKFLTHVFHLFPENEMHELIDNTAKNYSTDKDIYIKAQSKLDEISPTLSIFTYQLPSLFKQKDEMAKQAVMLLGENRTFDGYLEIGSSGRYLDYLEEKANITGPRYYADGKEPGYSITEMVDRGQVFIGADYIPLADYRTRYADIIPNDSLDLVTVYIGFHHCPLNLRVPFISSIRDTMRMGASLILRDHDCHDEDQETIVALAHDVFNMGTNETWEYNAQEIRNFYSLDFIIDFVQEIGFKYEKQSLYQEGDPTKNALMLFTKV